MVSHFANALIVLAIGWAGSSPSPPLKPGSTVVVISNDGALMRGPETVAILRKGQRLIVDQVSGQWLGTSVLVDGTKKAGWVHSDTVLNAGDTVTVAVENVQLMSGKQVVATLPKGQQFAVADIAHDSLGIWLAGFVDVDGETKSGWVHIDNVSVLPGAASKTPDSQPSQSASSESANTATKSPADAKKERVTDEPQTKANKVSDQPANASAHDASSPASGGSAKTWKTYVSDDGRFSVDIPPGSTVTAEKEKVLIKGQDTTCRITYSDLDEQTLTSKTPEELLDRLRDVYVARIRGSRIQSEKRLPLDHGVGRECEVKLPSNLQMGLTTVTGVDFVVRLRIYLVGRRQYVLFDLGERERLFSKEATRLYASFTPTHSEWSKTQSNP